MLARENGPTVGWAREGVNVHWQRSVMAEVLRILEAT
jgi:hypothetical protein